MVTAEQLSIDLALYASRLVRSLGRIHDQPAAMRVLSILDQYGAIGVTALATADGCSQPTMSGTVARLRELAWVATTVNPSDARGSLVELTDAGRAELARARQANGRLIANRLAAHPGRTVDELATAVEVLRALTGQPEGDR